MADMCIRRCGNPRLPGKKICGPCQDLERKGEGWGRLASDNQRHYYRMGKSLCDVFFDPGYPLDPELPDDLKHDACRKCRRLMDG